jgi:hypothetical protein
MSKRTLALIAFLTALTAFFVYLAVSQNQPQKTVVTKVAPTKTPIPAYTTLQLSPESLVLSSNSGSLQVLINTGTGTKTNAVTAVQLELQYDPKMLSTVSITPGTFIPSATALVNSIDQQTGRITYALAIPPSGSGATGKGTVATLRFTSLIPRGGSTEVTILPTTLVTAQGVTESVFLNGTGATISSGTGTISVAPSVIQGNIKENAKASEKSMKNKNPQGPKN